jgi:purine-binding chemotaxis protein CheW
MSQAVEQRRLDVLVFEVGGQRYGLPVVAVREIVRAVALVPLPRAPAIVEGVINLRGNIVPVFNIRSRFRLPAKPIEPTDHLIAAWAGERLVALRVDHAVGLVQVDGHEVEDARSVVPGADYVAWIAKLPHDLVLIHDLATFLSRAESAQLQDALAPDQLAGEEAERP